MYELALCAGIGGLSRGLQDAGIRSVCYVENDPYRVQVLLARIRDGNLDNAPIWDNIKTFDGKLWRGRVHLVASGFPCQPFSSSGQRRGKDDDRYLWPHVYRIFCEVRPWYLLLENVAGLLMEGDRPAPIADILSDLVRVGYDAEWRVLRACDFGAPHERERVFLVAYPHESRRQAILRTLPQTSTETYEGWPSTLLDTPGDYIQAMEKRLCQPALFGSNDGTAYRVERLAAVGEAVVRQVASAIGRCLMEDYQAHSQQHTKKSEPITHCLHCGTPIEQPPHGGRPRRFCDKAACRKAASRQAKEEAKMQQNKLREETLREHWQSYKPATKNTLEEILRTYGLEAAEKASQAVVQEREVTRRKRKHPTEQLHSEE